MKKTYKLKHPVNGSPAVANVAGFYRDKGKVVGLEVQFPGGHRAMLTYAEIEELQRGYYEVVGEVAA